MLVAKSVNDSCIFLSVGVFMSHYNTSMFIYLARCTQTTIPIGLLVYIHVYT